MSLLFFFYQNLLAPGVKLGACSSFVLGDHLDAMQVQNWVLQILNVSSHSQNNAVSAIFWFWNIADALGTAVDRYFTIKVFNGRR